MLCPNCKTELSMAERKGIEIDFCPQCRGIWLDRGELDKIIERSLAETAQPQAPSTTESKPYAPEHKPYAHDPRRYQEEHKRYGHQKKQKSFFSELFDFD